MAETRNQKQGVEEKMVTSRPGRDKFRRHRVSEERFLLAKTARRGSGLSALADAFAGANAKEKVGLLRSKWRDGVAGRVKRLLEFDFGGVGEKTRN